MPITPGDSLEPLMVGTGWLATQAAVDAAKVNSYADEMAKGNWRRLSPNRQNPIILDQSGKIMSGHHRLVAAQIAGLTVPELAIQRFPGMTSRPVKLWRNVRVRREKVPLMGFESYTVVLTPKQAALPAADPSMTGVQQVVEDLRQKWPVIYFDEAEAELRSHSFPLTKGEVCLVYETAQGLFQMLLTSSRGRISVSARFAYCNPHAVYQPFIEVISWLMAHYRMSAYVMASDSIPDLADPDKVAAVLIPSMDYNRSLWQADARTGEEAILRPAEAIERFISPHSLTATLV